MAGPGGRWRSGDRRSRQTAWQERMTALLRVYPELLFAWHGHSLLITDRKGNIESGLQGLYWHDLRLLSRYRLLVDGEAPSLDSLSTVDAYSTLGYYFSKASANVQRDLDALGLPKQESD